MAAGFHLKVVTPSGAAYDKPVMSVTATTEAGEITVLPEHCLLLSALEAGRLVAVGLDGTREQFVLNTGFLEAGPDHVNIISENCLAAGDIDPEKLAKEAEEIRKKLDDEPDGSPIAATLKAQLAWVDACLVVFGDQ